MPERLDTLSELRRSDRESEPVSIGAAVGELARANGGFAARRVERFEGLADGGEGVLVRGKNSREFPAVPARGSFVLFTSQGSPPHLAEGRWGGRLSLRCGSPSCAPVSIVPLLPRASARSLYKVSDLRDLPLPKGGIRLIASACSLALLSVDSRIVQTPIRPRVTCTTQPLREVRTAASTTATSGSPVRLLAPELSPLCVPSLDLLYPTPQNRRRADTDAAKAPPSTVRPSPLTASARAFFETGRYPLRVAARVPLIRHPQIRARAVRT